MFVSVKAELIDMSYFDEWENVRARMSGGRDKPTMWSECRFNSAVDRGSTCGEETLPDVWRGRHCLGGSVGGSNSRGSGVQVHHSALR